MHLTGMPSDKNRKILFLCPYPENSAPGQRFRFEQYLHVLSQYNITYKLKPLLSQRIYDDLYSESGLINRILYLLNSWFIRPFHLVEAMSYDYVFIFRELAPLGPPIFEWILVKVFRKKIIYDFDDAIWLEDHKERDSMLAKLKWKSKVGSICKWSFKVSVGNEYLAAYARKFSDNVIVNPTTIDTQLRHNPGLYKMLSSRKKQEMCIGWTGTHSTLQYLSEILPVLKKLEEQYEFKFRVISNKRPDFELRNAEFVPWQKETEIEDLMAIDIGIMPLTDDPWSRGKCGFKALQYMALQKPALVSPVGVNTDIVEHGVTGYHCQKKEDWYEYLTFLLENPEKRIQMGVKGRKYVQDKYSVQSNTSNFLKLFDLV